MDQSSFDRIARLLGGATTRRSGMGAVLGGLLGLSALDADARSGKHGGRGTGKDRGKPGAEGPCGSGKRKDNICTKDSQCCTGICDISLGKKNKDRKGRCRCLKRGQKCTASRNCCRGTCTGGVCGSSGPKPSACTSDSQCGGATPFCIAGTCVACASDSDCSGRTPICANGACAACTADSDCTGRGDSCTNGRCTCGSNPACSGATDTCTAGACMCGTGPACSGAAGYCSNATCVPCTCPSCVNPDCGNPTVRSGGSIQAAIDAAASGEVIAIAPGTYTGDLVLPAGANLTLVGCPFGGAEVILLNATDSVRAIDGTAGVTLDLIDIVMQGNTSVAANGGGISAVGAVTMCAATRVENVTWPTEGGGVGVTGISGTRSTLHITDSATVKNNHSPRKGGGVLVGAYTDGTIDGSATIDGNVSDSYGGGVVIADTATLVVEGDAVFSTNHGKKGSGGITVVLDPTLTADTPRLTVGGNAVFDGNISDSYGGGIGSVFSAASTGFDLITIKDSAELKNNTSAYPGGAIGCYHVHLIVTDNVKITNNTQLNIYQAGGGIGLNANDPKRSRADISGNVKISGNHSNGPGGGIFANNTDYTLSDTVSIDSNTADSYGGGAFMRKSTLTITGSATITGNTSAVTNGGGGVYGTSQGGGTNTLTAPSGSITGNTPNQCAGNVSC